QTACRKSTVPLHFLTVPRQFSQLFRFTMKMEHNVVEQRPLNQERGRREEAASCCWHCLPIIRHGIRSVRPAVQPVITGHSSVTPASSTGRRKLHRLSVLTRWYVCGTAAAAIPP